MTQQEQVDQIQNILEQVRPAVNGDGGNIELVKFEDDIVYLRLEGACVGCPSSFYTLKFGIESALKEKMPHIRDVVAVE